MDTPAFLQFLGESREEYITRMRDGDPDGELMRKGTSGKDLWKIDTVDPYKELILKILFSHKREARKIIKVRELDDVGVSIVVLSAIRLQLAHAVNPLISLPNETVNHAEKQQLC
eukprot:471509-Pyramimonas_sp.AAC.1